MSSIKNLNVTQKLSKVGKLILANNPIQLLIDKKRAEQLKQLEVEDRFYPRTSEVSEMYGKKGWLDPQGRMYLCSRIDDPQSVHAEWAQEFLKDKLNIDYEFENDAFVYLAKDFHFAIVVDTSTDQNVNISVIPYDKYELTPEQAKVKDQLVQLYQDKPYQSVDLKSYYSK